MAKKHGSLALNPAARARLTAFMEQMLRQRSLPGWRRAQAVGLAAQGRTVPEIAGQLQCSQRAVYQCLEQYQKSGLAGLAPKFRPVRLTGAQMAELMTISGWDTALQGRKDLPKAWSFRKIAQWIKKHWQIKISHEWVRQLIIRKMMDSLP